MAIRPKSKSGKILLSKNFFYNPEDRIGKKRALFSIVNKPAVQDFRFRFYDKKPESEIAAAGVRYVKIEYRRVFGGAAPEEGLKKSGKVRIARYKIQALLSGT